MSLSKKKFFLDVDGVLSTGQFIYSEGGKMFKVFGPHDSDGLKMINEFIEIRFISADKRGFEISKKRVEDMGYEIDLVGESEREEYLLEKVKFEDLIYMGDGIFDHYVMKEVRYSIAPSNGDPFTKKAANFVTQRSGGDRSVAEACLHILDKFFEPYNPNKFPDNKVKFSGEWAI